jgi:prevent-host-death family protein
MKSTGINDARPILADLAREAANGTPTVLTKRGKPLAEVVPVGTWAKVADALGPVADAAGDLARNLADQADDLERAADGMVREGKP